MHKVSFALGVVIGLLSANCNAAEGQTFKFREPFGLPHQNEILEFSLTKSIKQGSVKLIDSDGQEVPFQISKSGKKLLLRTDLAANEQRSWQLVDGKPTRFRSSTATSKPRKSEIEAKPKSGTPQHFVEVTKNTNKGWYEITNGVTGLRIPLPNQFTNEAINFSNQELAQATERVEGPDNLRKDRQISAHNPAPVQGIQLKNGTWAANGPNVLQAKAFCTGAKVDFIEEGPLQVVVKLSYQFKGKPAIPRPKENGVQSSVFPGGDGYYHCTMTIIAGEPSIIFEEDSDVITSWRLNLLPELHCDMARHPERQGNGVNQDVDFQIPFDADYTTSYETRGKGIVHLRQFDPFISSSEYYWMLFNSSAGANSPVIGVFADRSMSTIDADASGPGLVSSDNWMQTGEKGAGFNVQIGRMTPDARSFPFVKIRWGLFVETKDSGLAPLSKMQPIMNQINLHGGMVSRLRDVVSEVPIPPRIDWQERSDWINVKTKVQPNAIGDGISDDTDAIQAALSSLKEHGYDSSNVVYLPPGTYRISRTLHWQNVYGARLIGHGRDTRIVWDGDNNSPAVMFHSNGASSGVVFDGIVWDGAGKAEVGISHASGSLYESHVTHRNEAFYNLGSGIVTSASDYFEVKQATAEVLFDNCLFVNNANGIVFGSYNALDNTVIDCGFYHCRQGIANPVGNFYARRCHFEGSLEQDIYTHVGDCAARRCTSTGSRRFLYDTGRMFVMQDCHVEGWKSTKGAVVRGTEFPFTIFDCTFKDPPDKQPPFQGGGGSPILISNCSSKGTTEVLSKKDLSKAISIPAGKRGSAVKSASQTFFETEVRVPMQLFDAKLDFNAIGDGKSDDTKAVLATILAAKDHGNGAMAYFPSGRYLVSKTIEVSGENYVLSGSGIGHNRGTAFVWGGNQPEPDQKVAVIHVKNANNVTIQDLKALTPSTEYEEEGMLSVLHNGSDANSYVTYNEVAGFVEFDKLSERDRINIVTIAGVMHFDSCDQAKILVEQFYPTRHPKTQKFFTSILVKGKRTGNRGKGLVGLMTMFNSSNPHDITIEDSQDLVISDYYTEQTDRLLVISGNSGDVAGRVTLQIHKLHGLRCPDLVEIRNYKGALFLGATFNPTVPDSNGQQVGVPFICSQEGSNPIDIMLVGCGYPTGEPVFRGERNATLIRANEVVESSQKSAPKTLTEANKSKISEALDHLRELGELDLEFKRSKLD